MAEDQFVEWKERWHDEHLRWVCGFANAQGGKLLIGVNDQGIPIGIDQPEVLLEQLPNKFRDILGIFAEVNLAGQIGRHHIEIMIPRYDVPVSYRGKYFVRTGSTLQELKGLALNEFILKRTGKTWDDLPEQRASLSDIDESSISQFIADARIAGRIQIEGAIGLMDLLNKLRLTENKQIKRAGIVLFGKDPGKFYSNMAIKIGSFGPSEADLKHHEIIEGNLIQLKSLIGEILNSKFFIRPINFAGMQRIEKDEYPVAAIREMILNALVHRSYQGSQTQIRLIDGSFSIWNDGGLPEGITEEDLLTVHRSKPRNPLVADVCFKAGYIDAWGRGTLKIIEACRDAGLPNPVLKEEQGGFVATIYKDRFSSDMLSGKNLNERQIKAIQYLKEYDIITNHQYTVMHNITDRTALRDLQDMVVKKLIRKEGHKKGTHYLLNDG